MNIDEFIDKAIEVFKNEAGLQEVNSYHKVKGMLLDAGINVSINCEKINYAEYNSDEDQANAEMSIYVYASGYELEAGYMKLHELTDIIRCCLYEAGDLYKIVSSITVSEIKYFNTVSELTYFNAGARDTGYRHSSVINLQLTYLQPKKRAKSQSPTEKVETINNEIEGE